METRTIYFDFLVVLVCASALPATDLDFALYIPSRKILEIQLIRFGG